MGLLAGLTGCGSGDSTAAQQAEAIPLPQYIKKADAICTKTDKRQEKLAIKVGKEGADLGSKQGLEVLVRKAAIPPLEEESQQLTELPPPASKGGLAAEYLTSVKKGIVLTEKEPLALPNAAPGAGPFGEAEGIARTVGFKVCRGA